MNYLFIAVLLLTLFISIAALFVSDETFKRVIDKHITFEIFGYIGVMCIMIIVPMELGMISRGESSPSPLKAYEISSNRHGSIDGIFSFISTSIFLIWSFVLPGHLYANHAKKNKMKRPIYPYVINAFIGMILCAQGNIIYKIIGFLARVDSSPGP